ncbi:hypothetical protein CSOJ01_04428 [Colletotrichum sojae]|uniref:Uncharacterized protein n=1 Tax=Colletotrichum sojae TaxID=2175907 RepID=A0A8H6JID6_9PEZI|nr:hypothetical protein CSOJ01_04428 [Colletotrichum sojae]
MPCQTVLPRPQGREGEKNLTSHSCAKQAFRFTSSPPSSQLGTNYPDDGPHSYTTAAKLIPSRERRSVSCSSYILGLLSRHHGNCMVIDPHRGSARALGCHARDPTIICKLFSPPHALHALKLEPPASLLQSRPFVRAENGRPITPRPVPNPRPWKEAGPEPSQAAGQLRSSCSPRAAAGFRWAWKQMRQKPITP